MTVTTLGGKYHRLARSGGGNTPPWWLFFTDSDVNAHFYGVSHNGGDNTPPLMAFLYGEWRETRIFMAFRTKRRVIRRLYDGFSIPRVTWNAHFYGVLCTTRMDDTPLWWLFIRRTRRAASNRPCPRARNDEARAMVSWCNLIAAGFEMTFLSLK
jgi:hypothetical protein